MVLKKLAMDEQIRLHYETKRPTRRRLREEGVPCGQLRRWNNFVKAAMLRRYITEAFDARGPVAFLDVCCGAGGDLPKVARHARMVSTYVGFDLAAARVDEARRRARGVRVPVEVFQHDANDDFAAAALARAPAYSVVSCQLGPHFACSGPGALSAFASRIARVVRPGGFFIGSLPDADVLAQRSAGAVLEEGGRRFGNRAYSVVFAGERLDPLALGSHYTFSLAGCVDRCPEFVAPWHHLRAAFEHAGFDVAQRVRFLDVADARLQRRMHARVPADEDEREACALYVAFAFRRRA